MVSQVMGASSQINIRRRMPQVSRRVRDLLLLVILSEERSDESKDDLLLLPICHHERSEGSALSSAVILSGARFGRSRRTCFYFRFVITSEARDLLFLPPSS